MISCKEVDRHGALYYNEDRQLHRTDGPAVDWEHRKEWRLNG
jgi:hypothetical protein